MRKEVNGKIEKISIEGHVGTWYVLDSKRYGGEWLHLIEHETYGDAATCLIVNSEGKIMLDEAWNGWDDYDYYLETKDY